MALFSILLMSLSSGVIPLGPANALAHASSADATPGITATNAASTLQALVSQRRRKQKPVAKPAGSSLRPIVAPNAAHPLILLKIGDSLGEELGFGLRDLLVNVHYVTVLQEAIGDSGLARPDFYNWPLHLRVELAQYHPSAVVVMLGGDDGQGFVDAGRSVEFGTALWSSIYSQRVASLMAEATSSGAHVMWIGLPIMGSPYFSSEMAKMNAIYIAQSAHHPGVTFVPTWSLFANAAGAYSAYLPGASGQSELMRNPDGVHFSGAGEDRLAARVISAMNTAWKIHI